MKVAHLFEVLESLKDPGMALWHETDGGEQLKHEDVRAEHLGAGLLCTAVEWVDVAQTQADVVDGVGVAHDAVEADLSSVTLSDGERNERPSCS
jgi:hypothetical protein